MYRNIISLILLQGMEVERNDLRNNFFLKTGILIEAHFIEENIKYK